MYTTLLAHHTPSTPHSKHTTLLAHHSPGPTVGCNTVISTSIYTCNKEIRENIWKISEQKHTKRVESPFLWRLAISRKSTIASYVVGIYYVIISQKTVVICFLYDIYILHGTESILTHLLGCDSLWQLLHSTHTLLLYISLYQIYIIKTANPDFMLLYTVSVQSARLLWWGQHFLLFTLCIWCQFLTTNNSWFTLVPQSIYSPTAAVVWHCGVIESQVMSEMLKITLDCYLCKSWRDFCVYLVLSSSFLLPISHDDC